MDYFIANKTNLSDFSSQFNKDMVLNFDFSSMRFLLVRVHSPDFVVGVLLRVGLMPLWVCGGRVWGVPAADDPARAGPSRPPPAALTTVQGVDLAAHRLALQPWGDHM